MTFKKNMSEKDTGLVKTFLTFDLILGNESSISPSDLTNYVRRSHKNDI